MQQQRPLLTSEQRGAAREHGRLMANAANEKAHARALAAMPPPPPPVSISGPQPARPSKPRRKQSKWQQWQAVQAARERRAYRESAALGGRMDRDRD
jgi:hypothetical protein